MFWKQAIVDGFLDNLYPTEGREVGCALAAAARDLYADYLGLTPAERAALRSKLTI